MPSRDSNSTERMPADVNGNKSDKWKLDNPLKRLLSVTTRPHPISSNNSRNSSVMTRPPLSNRHGSGSYKKTDAPMLNLVYDSHIKSRYPDFR